MHKCAWGPFVSLVITKVRRFLSRVLPSGLGLDFFFTELFVAGDEVYNSVWI